MIGATIGAVVIYPQRHRLAGGVVTTSIMWCLSTWPPRAAPCSDDNECADVYALEAGTLVAAMVGMSLPPEIAGD